MEWIHHPRYSYMIEYYKVFCAKIQACVQKGHCENKLKSHRKNTVSFFLFVSVVLPSTLLLQAREFLPFWWVLVMKMSYSWSVPRSQGYLLAPVVSALRVVLFAFLLLKWAKPLPTSADDLKSVWFTQEDIDSPFGSFYSPLSHNPDSLPQFLLHRFDSLWVLGIVSIQGCLWVHLFIFYACVLVSIYFTISLKEMKI